MNFFSLSIPSVHLKPGELYIAREPTVISTVLGSCVSVVMFNSRLKMGAMSHGLLPEGDRETDKENLFRYVDFSTAYLFKAFLQQGLKPHEIEVKVFGGADMFAIKKNGNGKSVGKQNINMALNILEKNRLHPLSLDVGGKQGRKIFMLSHTGEVFLKRLNNISVYREELD